MHSLWNAEIALPCRASYHCNKWEGHCIPADSYGFGIQTYTITCRHKIKPNTFGLQQKAQILRIVFTHFGAICCSDINAATIRVGNVQNLSRPAAPPSPEVLEHENFLSRPPRCVSVTGNKQHCRRQHCLHATDRREAGGGPWWQIYKATPGGRCRFYSRSDQRNTDSMTVT